MKPQGSKRGRWFKRLGLALALVVSLIVVAALVAARMAEPWLRQQAVLLTQQKAQSELQLRSLEIDWWPLGLAVENLSLTLEGEPGPYAAVDRLVARASWRELLNGRLLIEDVVAEQPLLSIRIREDGSPALPRFEGDGGGNGRFQLESLELRNGEVHFEDGRLPLEVTLSGLRGESSSVGDRSSARLHADSLSVLADGRRLDFVLDGSVDWEGTQIPSIQAKARQDLLEVGVAGSFAQGVGAFDVTATGSLEVLAPWLGEEDGEPSRGAPLMGRAALEARVTNDRIVESPETESGWSVTGSGRVEDLRYADMHVAAVPLRFEILDGRVQVESEGLRAYGGEWDSQFGIDDGEAQIRVSGGGASLERLAADLGWPSLAAGGRLGGRADYRFATDEWRQGSGSADVQLAPGGAWTLAGTVPVEVQPGFRLGVAGVLSDARSRVELQGAFDAVPFSGTLDFAVATERIVDVQRQLGLSGDFLPAKGDGLLQGRLTLTDDAASPMLALDADLRHLELASIAADSASARLRLDGRGVVLESAEMRLLSAVDGEAPATLNASGVFPDGPRATRIDAEAFRWPVAQLLPLADLELPIDGLASGVVGLEVDPRRPEGQTAEGSVELTLDQPSWDETELGGTVTAPIRIGRGVVEIAGGIWSNLGQQLGFDFATREEGAWQAEVHGDDLEVARWRQELEFLGEDYRLSLDATLHGAETVRSANVRLATAVGASSEVQVLAGEVRDGEVDLSGDLARIASDVSVRGEISDAGPALRASGVVRLTDWVEAQEVDFDGSIRVELTSSGTWERPLINATSTDVEIVVAGQTLRQFEPLQAAFEDNVLRLESLYLVNPRTSGELFAAGSVDLSSGALDGVLQADLDAHWLGSAVAELSSTGSLSFLGTIEGSIDEPIVDGQGEWAEGTAQVEGFPHTLTDVGARFLIGAEGVIIDRASADLSGGTLDATGSVDLDPERGLSYAARVVARGISVNVPEGWWVGGDATLRITGDAATRLISGDVALERAVMLESVDLSVEQILRAAFQRQREWVPSTDEFLRSTRLQLQVTGEDALRVGGEGLNLGGDIDLSVAGDLASPLLLGRVDLSTGGQIVFRSNTFDIERGVLLFSNPHVIDPDIDLVAVSQVRSYDVRLHLQGTLEAMDIKFTSDPALPSLEVVSLLTTGQVGRQPLLLEPIAANESAAAEGLIAGQAAEVIGSRVGRLFGLDRVQVDPLTESSGSLSSARITVGKRLSEDVVATYSYDPTDSEEQVVQLDWQLTPTVAMVLTQNGDGSYAVDFKWQQSF